MWKDWHVKEEESYQKWNDWPKIGKNIENGWWNPTPNSKRERWLGRRIINVLAMKHSHPHQRWHIFTTRTQSFSNIKWRSWQKSSTDFNRHSDSVKTLAACCSVPGSKSPRLLARLTVLKTSPVLPLVHCRWFGVSQLVQRLGSGLHVGGTDCRYKQNSSSSPGSPDGIWSPNRLLSRALSAGINLTTHLHLQP